MFSKLSVSPKLVVWPPSFFMEETDVCYLTPTVRALHQAIPNGCPAKALAPSQRLTLGVHVLAGDRTVADLADEYHVSRKFVYQQAGTARDALQEAFAALEVADDQVLFHLPVTKAWLRQATLGLTLICHSSFRNVQEFFRDLLDFKISIGSVHNIHREAVAKARFHNLRPYLKNIAYAALDELFQSGRPVLVGVDVASTYCFLLSLENHRDADTWGVRLLELQERGFAPKSTIADFATGLRAGQELAMPGTPCRGDVFHVLQEITPFVTYVENRAYDAIAARHCLEQKKSEKTRQGCSAREFGQKLRHARLAESKAVALADDVALLAHWLHYDILAVSGLPYADRCILFDFIALELKAREHLRPHRIKPVRKLLENQRDKMLAFALELDHDLMALAKEFKVPALVVRELLNLQALDPRQPQRWQKQAVLQQKLCDHFHSLSDAVHDLAEHTVRASSVIENLNSRLRPYFFLRKQLGADYLVLLQFFLNHRRFLRSEHPERVDKSPAELLTGESHPHWLEMLGCTPFSRN
jgi:hypothetical protein